MAIQLGPAAIKMVCQRLKRPSDLVTDTVVSISSVGAVFSRGRVEVVGEEDRRVGVKVGDKDDDEAAVVKTLVAVVMRKK